MQAKELITKLDNLIYQIDLAKLDRQAAIDSILTAQQKAEIENIRIEFDEQIEHAQALVDQLKDEVRQAVLLLGESVKTPRIIAVYSAPRITYDARAMDGLLLAMPEIAAFRRESEPSVAIRMK